MYHALVEKRTPPLHTVHITVDAFRQQMEWLAAEGFQTITISQLLNGFEKKQTGKYCVITFDDGYQSIYRYAMPLLKQYGFCATLYLTTAAVGQNDFSNTSIHSNTLPLNDKPLTWKEIKEMQANGWSIEAHSVTHSDINTLNAEQIKFEVAESRKIIEQQLKQPVLHYAFPFGKYNAPSLKVVRDAGYQTAATVHAGLCSAKNNLYRLPRLEINHTTTMADFAKKVETGFVSNKEKLKASARDIMFSNPAIKDISKKILGKKMN
jgi:peptidoglycan/xylan/chitin deacetylase (PgdA/CDA1 family)